MKDYYAILGVYPKAEDIVIRAAYKALAQRYHPDRFDGPREIGEARMKELNEAYAVLSDPKRREEYDKARAAAGEPEGMGDDESEADFSEAAKTLDDDWAFAKDYYSDLDDIAKELTKFSSRLAFAYRVAMLEGKDFNQRREIADAMQAEFLHRYFGKNDDILAFAKQLILAGKRTAAMELNRAVNVLGTRADSGVIIWRISQKYGLAPEVKPHKPLNSEERRRISDLLLKFDEYPSRTDVEDVIKLLGGELTSNVKGSIMGRFGFDIRLWGQHLQFGNDAELFRWAITDLPREIRKRYGDVRRNRPP